MRDLRLALRLVRRAGARDVWLLTTMCLGIAVTVFCVALAGAAPIVSTAQQLHDRARVATGGDAAAALGTAPITHPSYETLGGEPYLHVAVEGATPTAARPPGVASWPTPGHTVVSPAMAELLAHDRGLAAHLGLGLVDAQRITQPGLMTPRELVAYTVLDDRPRANGDFFGARGSEHMQTPFKILLAEIAVLVLLPALVFLAACLRASAASRERRYRSLVLMGVSPRRCARMYAGEIGLVAVVGVLLGTLGYEMLQGPLGESDLLGVSWWGDDGRLAAGGIISCVFASVLLLLVAVRAAHLVMLATLSRSPRRREVGPRWRRVATLASWVVLAMLGPCLAYLGVVIVRARPGDIVSTHTSTYTHTLQAALLALALAPFAATVLVRSTVSRLRGPGPVVRSASRSTFHHWPAMRRIVWATGAVVIVTTFGNTFVEWTRCIATSGSAIEHQQLIFPYDEPDPSVDALMTLRRHLVVSQVQTMKNGDPVRIQAIRCVPADPIPCPTRPGRGSFVPDTAVLTLSLPGRRTMTVRATDAPLVSGSDPEVIALDLDRVPQIAHSVLQNSPPSFELLTTGQVSDIEDALAEVHRVAPRVVPGGGGYNDTRTLADEQALIMRTSLSGATILLTGAFALAMAGIAAASRRSANALVAAGAPSSFLRGSRALSACLPVLLAGVVTAVPALLASWALLAMFGAEHVTADSARWSLLPALAATAVTAAWGWVAGGHRFDRRLLRE